MKRLKQAWKRDQLGVLGVGSAVAAFVFWGFPVGYYCTFSSASGCIKDGLLYISNGEGGGNAYFTPERLPVIGAFLALAVILLLLRRR